MAARHRPWSAKELLLVFRLYCRTPFGRLHQKNPEIVMLASKIGRTPSAVAMKGCNFAGLDPLESQRVSGLGNASEADRELWDQFKRNSEAVAAAAESAWAELELDAESEGPESPTLPSPEEMLRFPSEPSGETETFSFVRSRRVQTFFRGTILVAYENRCAITGLANPNLLNASHIIPWKDTQERRADPTNGLCLNALHDRAFDRGLITLDPDLKVVVAPSLLAGDHAEFHRAAFAAVHGRPLTLPVRFHPDPAALAYHREHIFKP